MLIKEPQKHTQILLKVRSLIILPLQIVSYWITCFYILFTVHASEFKKKCNKNEIMDFVIRLN